MKLTTTILFFTLLAFFALDVKSQPNPDVPKIIPASPNAAALGEYGNIPISLYTGLPDISIPIWDLKGREINLPLSLSYRASGVKVEENASWVGLGWSLNAGGVITRTVRDNPDFSVGLYGRVALPLSAVTSERFDYLENLKQMDGVIDLEPDIFYYNFNGKAGSFIFDSQGNVRFNQFDDIKVKYTPEVEYVPGIGYYGQFEITTSDGTIYLFKDRETSSVSTEPSSWYLTKIISPSGNEIFDFIYDREDYSYQYAERDQRYTNLAGMNHRIVVDNTPLTVIGKRLKEINTNTVGRILFTPNTQKRVDFRSVYDCYALNAIKIYNSKGSQIREFKLETENIETAIRLAPNDYYFNNEYLNWRMYLKGVREYDSTGTLSKPPYLFTYYDRDANGKDKLPHRVSFAQDHWGYYNGMDNNASLVPAFDGPYGTTDPFFDIFPVESCFANPIQVNNSADRYIYNFLTGVRSPLSSAMRAGTLKNIQYPTGGRIEFEFESHYGAFSNPETGTIYKGTVGGLRIKSLTSFDNCGVITNKKEYEYAEGKLVSFPKYYTYLYNNGGTPSVAQACHIDPNVEWDNSVHLQLNAGSLTFAGNTKGSIIGYPEVTETEKGNGSSKYFYTNPGIYPDENANTLKYLERDVDAIYHEKTLALSSYFTWPFQPLKNNDWKRGLLTDKIVSNAFGQQIRSEKYEYGFEELGNVAGMNFRTINVVKYWLHHPYPNEGSYVVWGDAYVYAEYQSPFGWSYLKKKTITENGVSLETNMQYEPLFKYKRKETTLNSEGDSLTTTYKYSFDYNVAPYTTMMSRNIVSPVIETKTFKGAAALNTVTNGYKDWFSDQRVIAPEIVLTKQEPDGMTETRVRYHALNENGNILSVSKEGGSLVSYLWDYNLVYPIAEVRNAANEDIAYTSFEHTGRGNWNFSGGIIEDLNAQTGQGSYDLNGGNTISKGGLSASKSYVVSYWSRNGAYNVNNVPAKTGISTKGWTYYEHELYGINSVSIQGSGSIDEVRLCPKDAIMTTYTYNPSVGMTSSSDNRGEATYFKYDRLGRLETVKDYKGSVIKKLDYNYNITGQGNCNQIVYYNVEKSQNFMKSGCGIGAAPVIYKVSAKTFSSVVSQADADQKAQHLIDTYGQTYVNNSGSCIFYNDAISAYYSPISCQNGYEPVDVYVSVPANTYSSEISKQDANNKAVQYAQQYANEHGCRTPVPAIVNIMGSNPNSIAGFKAKFVNDITHVEYEFDINTWEGMIGQIPSGSYTITIYNPYSSSTTYTFGAAEYLATGTSVTFVSVNIATAEVVISIN